MLRRPTHNRWKALSVLMKNLLVLSSTHPSIPIIPLTARTWPAWSKKQPAAILLWAKHHQFSGQEGTTLWVTDSKNTIIKILAGVVEETDIWSFAHLSTQLPKGCYHIEGDFSAREHEQFALGWLLGMYNFDRYKSKPASSEVQLKIPAHVNRDFITHSATSLNLARDLINTPACDMGPSHLAAAAMEVAKECKAQCKIIVGEQLLKQNYPTIHMVGRAAADAPRLIDMHWGKPNAPKITLVGKGVCFDSGGLDIKNSSGMKLMKKDMGGAAAVLALARMIMHAKLPVRLRVLIPAVENSVSGNAFRPMDVVRTRSGMTVEVGNTDAEGRLILCDALTEADSEKPDLLIDCATLTGAARVALGTEVPAYFTQDDELARLLDKAAKAQRDPLWRLPLWQPYREMLKSAVADLNNAPDSGYGGAITAALYLKEFVKHTHSWLHVDMMAWNLSKRPGRPVGGEAMAVRALFHLIQEKFASKNAA